LNVLGHIGGIPETLAENLEAQFQPLNEPPVIKAVEEKMRANTFASLNELNLTNPAEF
jgi:hypothetical protein